MIRRRTSGFTLLEVLIALFILSAGIIVLSTAWSGNFLRIRKSGMFHDVATLLERKMLETEAKYKGKPLNEIPEEDKDDFGDNYKQYRWEVKSKDLTFPDISPLLTSQEGGAKEELLTMVKQMTEYLNTTIKEVKVSVFAKGKNGREVEFSAVQYFIDYNKPFTGLGGAAGAAGGNSGSGNTGSNSGSGKQ